jgi:hypothetical protein
MSEAGLHQRDFFMQQLSRFFTLGFSWALVGCPERRAEFGWLSHQGSLVISWNARTLRLAPGHKQLIREMPGSKAWGSDCSNSTQWYSMAQAYTVTAVKISYGTFQNSWKTEEYWMFSPWRNEKYLWWCYLSYLIITQCAHILKCHTVLHKYIKP